MVCVYLFVCCKPESGRQQLISSFAIFIINLIGRLQVIRVRVVRIELMCYSFTTFLMQIASKDLYCYELHHGLCATLLVEVSLYS